MNLNLIGGINDVTETLNRAEMWKGWTELPQPKEGNTGKYVKYQEFLYKTVKDLNPINILEIGFNAGHSACCFLNAAPNAKMVTFDLCRWDTEKSAEKVLSAYFDITLIEGNSIETVPNYFKNNPEISFDFMFIDGGHMGQTPYLDYKNTKNHINNNGIYVLDDMDGPSVFSGYKRHTWDNFELVKVPLIEKEIIVLKKKG